MHGIKVAFATALIFTAIPVALAADEDPNGGFRELGNGETVKEGVNPVDHPSLREVPAVDRERREDIGRRELQRARPEGSSNVPRDNDGPEAGKE